MHEGTVCREILDIAVEAAKENDIKAISCIYLVKGVNSCLHDDELQFYFSVAKKGTCAENAQLVIEVDKQLVQYHSEYVKSIEGE
jgi:Zn finger protein HypA/HybF involved in hydrogenase expression